MQLIYFSKCSVYVIEEMLGKGTFGQVVSCVLKNNNQKFALKVIKNKPAYFL